MTVNEIGAENLRSMIFTVRLYVQLYMVADDFEFCTKPTYNFCYNLIIAALHCELAYDFECNFQVQILLADSHGDGEEL